MTSNFNRNSKGQFIAGNTCGLADPVVKRKAQDSKRRNKEKASAPTVEISQADYRLLCAVKETLDNNELHRELHTFLTDVPDGLKRRIAKSVKDDKFFETLAELIMEYMNKTLPTKHRKWVGRNMAAQLLPKRPLGVLYQAVIQERIDLERERREKEEHDKYIDSLLADLEEDSDDE